MFLNDVEVNIVQICSSTPRCGKDTIGNHLVEKYNYHRFAYADELKKVCKDLGWDGEKDKKGRRFLIDIGIVVRGYNEDSWVKLVSERIMNELTPEGMNIVITDLRFENEAIVLKKMLEDKGIKVNQKTLGVVREDLLDTTLMEDPSQIEYFKIPKDLIIYNDSTIDVLKNKVDAMMEME